jgi:hypothetical protein
MKFIFKIPSFIPKKMPPLQKMNFSKSILLRSDNIIDKYESNLLIKQLLAKKKKNSSKKPIENQKMNLELITLNDEASKCFHKRDFENAISIYHHLIEKLRKKSSDQKLDFELSTALSNKVRKFFFLMYSL